VNAGDSSGLSFASGDGLETGADRLRDVLYARPSRQTDTAGNLSKLLRCDRIQRQFQKLFDADQMKCLR
jgi:hypothetical protein